jgi:hypothetical protein
MTKDNVTGKNKDFYDLGKKIFDRLNPQGAINPKIVEPKKKWVGLTDEEIASMHHEIKVKGMGAYKTEDIYRAIEAKLKEKNG